MRFLSYVFQFVLAAFVIAFLVGMTVQVMWLGLLTLAVLAAVTAVVIKTRRAKGRIASAPIDVPASVERLPR